MQKVITRHEYGPGGSYLFSPFTQLINNKDIKTIFEAGSRDLLDAIALKNYYSGSTVYAFECNPEGIKTCLHNIQSENNIIFTPIALTDTDGQKTFYSFDSDKTNNHNHGVSSFYKHKNETDVPQTAITVNCSTIDTFCAQNNITEVDMFCFDMQGGEYSALIGAKNILKTVKYIILENDGHSYQQTPDFVEIENFLHKNDFILIQKVIGDCLYINTRLLPLSQQEIITGNQFKNICDEYIDEDKPYINLKQTPKNIFLKTDWVEIFKQKVLPQINYNFNLITHNADRSIISDNIDLLNNKFLIRWYGMNCHIQHPKLQSIPIGIANEKWPHGNKDVLLEVINTEIPKTGLCYSNFEVSTNFSKRNETLNIIKTKPFINSDTQKHSFKDYLTKLKSYKYVISPPGNSVDCHRVWEALYLGVIPIIEKNIAMEYFYDLPILVVDSFNNVTEELLINSYETVFNKPTNKAKFSFYKNLIFN